MEELCEKKNDRWPPIKYDLASFSLILRMQIEWMYGALSYDLLCGRDTRKTSFRRSFPSRYSSKMFKVDTN